MINNFCFYSRYGNGDLFNSRELVRYMVLYSGIASSYFYSHAKSPDMFSDIPRLIPSTMHEFMTDKVGFIKGEHQDFYMNTWIGRENKFVLPGIGCTLDNYLLMFNDILKKASLPEIPGETDNFIPDIDYAYYPIQPARDWVAKNYHSRMVLICNGNAWSNQAFNFDFSPIVKLLVEKYKDIKFITTERIDFLAENLYFSGDIVQKSGQDLNEISFLSMFCDIIIGRSSGPYVFTQVKRNFDNPNKTFISFTYHKNSSSLLDEKVETKAKLLWSPATKIEEVYNKIQEVI